MILRTEVPAMDHLELGISYPHEVALAPTGLEDVRLYGLSSYTLPDRSRDTVVALDQFLADRLSGYAYA